MRPEEDIRQIGELIKEVKKVGFLILPLR